MKNQFVIGQSFLSIIATMVLGGGASSANAQLSTFDTDNEGWRSAGLSYTARNLDPASSVAGWDLRGNPGGALWIGDEFGETFAQAPSSYLGDKSNAYGGILTFDIQIRFSDEVAYPGVFLVGDLYTIRTILNPTPINAWGTQTVQLSGDGWILDSSNGGGTASQEQIQHTLQNLLGLYIYTEWKTGPDDTSLDNVSFPVSDPVCPADLNSDGNLDFFDVSAFLTAFSTGDLIADFSGDGFLDFFDVSAFLAAFAAGCP